MRRSRLSGSTLEVFSEQAGRLMATATDSRQFSDEGKMAMRLRTASRLTLVFGAFSVVAMVAASLALQDIYHGEPDLTLEWRILRVASLVILAFHGLALTVAWKATGVSGDSD